MILKNNARGGGGKGKGSWRPVATSHPTDHKPLFHKILRITPLATRFCAESIFLALCFQYFAGNGGGVQSGIFIILANILTHVENFDLAIPWC